MNFNKVKTKYLCNYTSPNNGADGMKNSESIRGQVRLLGIPEYLVFFYVHFLERRLLWVAFSVKAHVEGNLLPFNQGLRTPYEALFSLKSRTFGLRQTNWADKFWAICGIFG